MNSHGIEEHGSLKDLGECMSDVSPQPREEDLSPCNTAPAKEGDSMCQNMAEMEERQRESSPNSTSKSIVSQSHPDARNYNERISFYYDTPLYEETGFWIPVSVPPMTENEHAEWTKGFCSKGGYIPEEDMGWSQCIGKGKELTMWDVVVEMLLVARGKASVFASGDIGQISFKLAHIIEQAWDEMAQTLTEANFCNTQEIIESDPPKWLPDCSASACMLCSVHFHPIMCARHHCRFCGGIFCGECSKGRS